MGSEDEVEQSLGRPCRRQVQADMRTHLIHRPARDVIPPPGGARSILLSHLILNGRHTAAASLVHLNSLPSVQMRCIMTAKRRASATIAFFIPRCLAIFIAQALSQDHFDDRNSMTWAASYSVVRIISSPQREMAPGRSRSPDWSLAGVNPNTAPTDFDFRKRAGTSTVAR